MSNQTLLEIHPMLDRVSLIQGTTGDFSIRQQYPLTKLSTGYSANSSRLGASRYSITLFRNLAAAPPSTNR